ncbi:MAG: hypothetical protein H7A23_01365 [Leptospiraceae bacterium]|nr:hypothetical protein [Leptospiraceae bacterium]MCP5493181.1 hypothetical protein [Leptospiraceae bacterium]
MAYGTFKTLGEVGEKFNIESSREKFVSENSTQINEGILEFLQNRLSSQTSYVSENSISEMIIAPILVVISEKHNLPIWSHVRFDVSEEDGLIGVPDFLLAPASKMGDTYKSPVVCIAEVKKENFSEGWVQVLCEMIAAQRFKGEPQKTIYGIATGGSIWQFAKIVGKKFVLDPRIYSATVNLQQVLDVLNWFIGEAKKEL